jgi:methanogenic corrinoid protein MtbC1
MILEKIAKSLADLDKEETIALTARATLEGETPPKIVLQGLLSGLDEVAKRYEMKHLQRLNTKLFPWKQIRK